MEEAVKVVVSSRAKKQLEKTPEHIYRKCLYWIDLIKMIGLSEARKYKGFHDELLRGKREGQRSVRLSKSYRVFYRELTLNERKIIEIIEVNKHEY